MGSSDPPSDAVSLQETPLCATLLPMTQGEAGPDPLVGTTIAGKYKIVKLLGEGGMGCVYVGEQMMGTAVRKVAVKTLHKHLSHDAHVKARFQREVGTVAALEHPNTIQVFDFGAMDDGTLYIVMELVQGRSVADILEKEGAMPPARVENIMRQVCGSLEEAHGHGIIHRDLKPDNVVLCERAGTKDWVEVLDFGIAKRSSEHDPNEAKLTQQGMVLGTPPYMSPEQFTGQPIDVRSDIYSLAVMAYEMLTGKLPFEANTAWEWASKHMTELPRPVETHPLGPNVPDKMRHAIMRALAKNREERFSSVREFFDALSAGGAVAPVTIAEGAPSFRDAGAPAAPRAKTEMAQPMAGGLPPGMATPPQGAFSGPGGGPVASVPQGPTHAPQKKGGNGLVIGLGALAVILLGGGAIALVASKKNPTPVTPLTEITGTSSARTSSVDTDAGAMTDTPVMADAGELTPAGTTKVVVAPRNTGATKADAGKAGPVPTPIPTPTPPKKTPECDTFHAAKAGGRTPPATLNILEMKCRSSGGTP